MWIRQSVNALAGEYVNSPATDDAYCKELAGDQTIFLYTDYRNDVSNLFLGPRTFVWDGVGVLTHAFATGPYVVPFVTAVV